MKIALLHGAVINAGDFLIRDRLKELLLYFFKDAVIEEYLRNVLLEEYLDSINSCDVVVIWGGPLLSPALNNNFVEFCKKITKPLFYWSRILGN